MSRPGPAQLARRAWWWWVRRPPVWVHDVFSWGGATLGVAAGSLLLEQLLPIDGEGIQTGGLLPRIAAVLVSIGVWAIGWLARSQRLRPATLYYLKALQIGMPDLHENVMKSAAAMVLDVRSATAWVPARRAVLDVSQQVRRIGAELERAQNDDEKSTPNIVATNMLWPIALAVGFDWFPGERVTLREFESRGGVRDWQLADIRPTDRAEAAFAEYTDDLDGAAAADSVWISVRATQFPGAPQPWQADFVRNRLARQCDVRLGFAWPSTPAVSAGQVGSVQLGSEELAQCASAVARVVRQVAERYPNAVLVLSMRLPKTVAFAAGWAMAQLPGSGAWLAGLWDRLVLVNYDREMPGKFCAMRVREDQGDPEALLRRVEVRLGEGS